MKPYSLITGGVGFIGTNLAHHYLAQGEAAQAVFHFAAHVTVTSSLQEPLADFAVNTQAILDLLEALRQTNPTTPLVFTSTNKVYEELAALPLIQQSSHYAPLELLDATAGISKQQAFDFHSPCGCFKGATDQYVLDCRLPLLPKLAVRGVFLPVRRGAPQRANGIAKLPKPTGALAKTPRTARRIIPRELVYSD